MALIKKQKDPKQEGLLPRQQGCPLQEQATLCFGGLDSYQYLLLPRHPCGVVVIGPRPLWLLGTPLPWHTPSCVLSRDRAWSEVGLQQGLGGAADRWSVCRIARAVGCGMGHNSHGPSSSCKEKQEGATPPRQVRQGEVMCMQPGQLCGWGRRQRTATAHRVGGKSGPSDGEGSGCPLLLSLHTRLPPAEESGAGWIFWSGDRGCWVGWAQSGTSGWAGSPLSPRR